MVILIAGSSHAEETAPVPKQEKGIPLLIPYVLLSDKQNSDRNSTATAICLILYVTVTNKSH